MYKIAFVIGQLAVGGTERQLLTLVEHLDRQRFSPLVICLSESAPLADAFRQLDCSIQVLERKARGRLMTLWRVYQLLRAFRPDIVHTFAYAARAGIPAAKLAGAAKTIVAIRTDPYWQFTFWERWLFKQADLVLANSPQAIQTLAKLGAGLPPHRVIYNGLDLGKFEIERKKLCAPIPEQAALDGSRKIICAVARLDDVKALDVLIQAFAPVHRAFPDTQLWLVGAGPKRAELEMLARTLGLCEQVIFWGIRSDVAAILNHVTIGALSSKVEGLSNAIIEYMAAGLPVVATKVGGNSELVIEGETGFLVSSGDEYALSCRLSSLLENPELRVQFAQNGRKRVEAFFGVDRMAVETQSMYDELLLA
ncbi:glycosyltransferase [Anaerolineae bacterium CFX7]|nr:glycosyltransferase [Anaerolineae bacterium CFX7]